MFMMSSPIYEVPSSLISSVRLSKWNNQFKKSEHVRSCGYAASGKDRQASRVPFVLKKSSRFLLSLWYLQNHSVHSSMMC